MDWNIRIRHAIDYIEDNLTETIDYEEVAKKCYSSSYHFQRVFSILCGFTLGEYIRNRRLTLAANELISTDIKIIDLALKYGYESPDSFANAFCKFHGVLPSHARNNGSNLKSFSRLVLKLSLEGGSTMNYRIEEKEKMTLTGFKKHFTGIPGEREEQEKEFYLKTRALQYILKGLKGDLETNYDVITNIDDEGYDFYIANEISQFYRNNLKDENVLGEEFSKYFENIEIPKCTYAVFETERCEYPTVVFLDLRKQIASEWLPNSGYQLANAPEIVVTHWYKGENRSKRYRELWIPIEKA